jgi:di/tricarboxylate transporter
MVDISRALRILAGIIIIAVGVYIIVQFTPSLSPPSITPTPTSPTPAAGSIAARIVQVNATGLKLGTTSYAYIILANTGNIPITTEHVVTTAGRDFGFPLGYQSQSFTQDFNNLIEPGYSSELIEQFNFPVYDSGVYLGGAYNVSIQVYANGIFIDQWAGEVSLSS